MSVLSTVLPVLGDSISLNPYASYRYSYTHCVAEEAELWEGL